MRLTLPLFLCVAGTQAFAPASRSSLALPSAATRWTRSTSGTTTARSFGLDPSVFHDLPQQMSLLQDAFSSISVADAVATTADVAQDVAAESDSGWFGFLTIPIKLLLQTIHSLLLTVGLNTNSWGVAIVLLTILIKVVTFPLTKTQLESTNKMQAMQPAIKELQAKYQSNPEVMNQKIAEFYQTNEINPLAGCLPSIVQIPVFIGLYRAVLELAQANKLDESFLFLPNLEGPTYGAEPGSAADWILKGWTDGVPSLGWPDTIAFLILPVFLVISQYLSMELMQPKTDDPAQQQSNAILKVLPIMIGWFSLSVPAALSVYWVINNIITTGTSLIIRNSMSVETVTPSGTATASAPPRANQADTIFSPPRDKPAGFGDASGSSSAASDGVKPLTAIDAEIVEEKTGGGTSEDNSSKKRGGKKKRKKN
jgi:YidC/Oxa1 family membrane protein insertase